MITAVHTIIFSSSPAETRAFLRDVLGLGPAVDAGGGWLIFPLPPGEVGVHPAEEPGEAGRHQVYLMCDDLDRSMRELAARGGRFAGEPRDLPWGRLVSVVVPGAGELGLYQPRHPVAAGR